MSTPLGFVKSRRTPAFIKEFPHVVGPIRLQQYVLNPPGYFKAYLVYTSTIFALVGVIIQRGAQVRLSYPFIYFTALHFPRFLFQPFNLLAFKIQFYVQRPSSSGKFHIFLGIFHYQILIQSYQALSFQSVEPRTKPRTRLLLNQRLRMRLH